MLRMLMERIGYVPTDDLVVLARQYDTSADEVMNAYAAIIKQRAEEIEGLRRQLSTAREEVIKSDAANRFANGKLETIQKLVAESEFHAWTGADAVRAMLLCIIKQRENIAVMQATIDANESERARQEEQRRMIEARIHEFAGTSETLPDDVSRLYTALEDERSATAAATSLLADSVAVSDVLVSAEPNAKACHLQIELGGSVVHTIKTLVNNKTNRTKLELEATELQKAVDKVLEEQNAPTPLSYDSQGNQSS